jgi:hypothetical protein
LEIRIEIRQFGWFSTCLEPHRATPLYQFKDDGDGEGQGAGHGAWAGNGNGAGYGASRARTEWAKK